METMKDPTDYPIQTQPQQDALVKAVSQREVAEAQGAMLLAQRFPRDAAAAQERILIACQRPGLAEGAIYQYARGGTDITGPSIRLAEAIAQEWGNLTFGVREIEQRAGESTVEAFAWDLQTNVRQIKQFQVKHVRHTRQGTYALDSPRDIYEATANMGARRLRACILGLIPGDVVEAAVAECEKTLEAKADTSAEGIKKMLTSFEKYGVTKEQIEARLQRKLDAVTPAQLIGLHKIYTSMKDGMSVAADWFESVEGEAPVQQSGAEKAKQAMREAPVAETEGGSPEEAKAPETEPEGIETPAPDEAAVSPEGETVGLKDLVALCEEQFQRLGRTKPAQQKVKVAELAVAAGLKTVPEDWRELPADLLGQLLDMLKADDKVLGQKNQPELK